MADKLAFVTGTSRGLGRAVAQSLLEHGWRVRGCARESASDELMEHERYAHQRVDLADARAVERWCSSWAGELGFAHVALVNNAGSIEPMGSLTAATASALADALALNVAAPMALMGQLVRHAPRAARVRIVNVSSGAAGKAVPGWAAYCAAKAALAMASEAFALELAELDEHRDRDVAVCSFAPSVVATAMQEAIRAQSREQFPQVERFVSLHDNGRLLAPEQPAAALIEWIETSKQGRFDVIRYAP